MWDGHPRNASGSLRFRELRDDTSRYFVKMPIVFETGQLLLSWYFFATHDIPDGDIFFNGRDAVNCNELETCKYAVLRI